MNQDQMRTAIEWLRVNEGENGEREDCEAVADWLEKDVARREREAAVRAAVKEHGLSTYQVRAALRRAGL